MFLNSLSLIPPYNLLYMVSAETSTSPDEFQKSRSSYKDWNSLYKSLEYLIDSIHHELYYDAIKLISSKITG